MVKDVGKFFDITSLPPISDEDGVANRTTIAVKVVSLEEIESTAECFEKNRINLDKWTQLFYRKPDNKHGNFSMRPIDPADYEVSVNIDRYVV